MFSKTGVISVLIIFGVSYYWSNYVKRGPVYKSNKSLKGKTVIITGGNVGIGKATALELAKKGAKIIIASRNVAKSEKARQDIIQESGNSDIHAKKLDLSDFDNVREFAKSIDKSEAYVDYLINNAGSMDISGKTKSGVNKMFAVNHFGHFLLTNLLLNKMKAQSKSRPVRIINVGSEAYRVWSLKEEMLYEDASGFWNLLRFYGASKVANIYFTSELNERLKDYDITTYVIHPGAINSELGHGHKAGKLLIMFFDNVVRPVFMREPFYGAQTTLYCALDDEVVKYSGGYFKECSHRAVDAHAKNETMRKFLWSESLKVTGLL